MELMQASHQWASRPDDERFTSLTDLLEHTRRQREASMARVLPNRRVLAAPITDDESGKGLAIIERQSGAPALPERIFR